MPPSRLLDSLLRCHRANYNTNSRILLLKKIITKRGITIKHARLRRADETVISACRKSNQNEIIRRGAIALNKNFQNQFGYRSPSDHVSDTLKDTSTSVDGISENQLAQAINLEVDYATGKLKSVAGLLTIGTLSGVGDKTNYTEDANIDSSAKFLEVGYKDGGELVGMVSFVGISREVDLSGRLSTCAVADSVFVLGSSDVQNLQAANVYGNAKPQNIALLIESEIKSLSKNSLVRYVPKLNQIWILNGNFVLMFDLVTQSWFKRQFNSKILDVLTIGDEILIIKPDRVSKLDENIFSDSGAELTWSFQGRRHISHYDYLLKNTTVSYTPLDAELTNGKISAGKVVVNLSLKESGSSTRRRRNFFQLDNFGRDGSMSKKLKE